MREPAPKSIYLQNYFGVMRRAFALRLALLRNGTGKEARYCVRNAIALAATCVAMQAAHGADASISLATGWNLVGNSTNAPLDVALVLGDRAKVTSVWKWDSANSAWAFYSPAFASAADLSNYAASKGYQVLSGIAPGQGIWVNALSPFTFTLGAATSHNLTAAGLIGGWNLVATGNSVTPSAFNLSLGSTQATTGVVPINLTTLWAWDSASANWYFYAPSLEAKGGTALADYAAGKGYLDFSQAGKSLGIGVGFWVNWAAPSSVSLTPLTWDVGSWNNVSWQ